MQWICAEDGVPFAVGAPACPQCGSTTYREQGHEDGPVRSTATGEPIDTAQPAESAEPPSGGRKAGQRGATP